MVKCYTSLNPEKALIWRIVHRDNLPWLLDNGLHCGATIGATYSTKRAGAAGSHSPEMVLLMIRYTQGNLLECQAEALVNTVNTVGVMGKGIALMFKERFPLNMAAYAKACQAKQVCTGRMFITETGELIGPRWIVNFPTKQHWRAPSQMAWIEEGLQDLKRFLIAHNVRSIAIPPLGAGNGGLEWAEVKERIEQVLGELEGVDIIIYQPTARYQNVSKPQGVNRQWTG